MSRPSPVMPSTPSSRLKLPRQLFMPGAVAAAGAAFVAIGAVIGLLCDDDPSNFCLELARASLTFGIGLILGGAVKLWLDSYQETQKRLDEERVEARKKENEVHEVRERLLADLRDVYDRTETARLMVTAHKTGDAYGEQMQKLIGCQAVLLKFKRSLDLRRNSTQDVDPNSVCLPNMIGYLRALQNEYARNYLAVAECQRYDEQITLHRLRVLAAKGGSLDSAASHLTWDLLRNANDFPALHDLTSCGKQYTDKFVLPLHTLVAQLARTTDSSQPLDTELDHRVEVVARAIKSDLRADVEPVPLPLDEEEPTTCNTSAIASSETRKPPTVAILGDSSAVTPLENPGSKK
jgi:hypothetical protein